MTTSGERTNGAIAPGRSGRPIVLPGRVRGVELGDRAEALVLTLDPPAAIYLPPASSRPDSSAPFTDVSRALSRYSASASAEAKRPPGAPEAPWWARTQCSNPSSRSSDNETELRPAKSESSRSPINAELLNGVAYPSPVILFDREYRVDLGGKLSSGLHH